MDFCDEPAGDERARQRLPAARRRTQLLEVALDRFAANGFHQTSMEEIAEAAGVTKPVLYQHFGSKRTLYLELLETVGNELLAGGRGPGRRREPSVSAGAGRLPGLLPIRVRADQRLPAALRGRRPAGRRVCRRGPRHGDERGGHHRGVHRRRHRRRPPRPARLRHRRLGRGDRRGYGSAATRRRGHPTSTRLEAEVLAVRLADLVWAGLRGLPGGTPPVTGPKTACASQLRPHCSG